MSTYHSFMLYVLLYGCTQKFKDNYSYILAHHLIHSKQHSPSNRSTNLRVVIPSTPTSSNINSDDLNYGEVIFC